MSAEYRRGIPSTAHVEAATRLGIEWHRESHRDPHNSGFFTRFRYVDGQLCSNYTEYSKLDDFLTPVSPAERTYSYRPIRPDGTPVDWEVLDQEVARMGQQGQPQTMACNLTASPQSRGFRADLWRRICRHFIGAETDTYNQVTFDDIVSLNDTACHFTQFFWDWRDVPGASATQTDILARWTVYQELKPLYDIVDGAQGEVAMPADVEAEWHLQATTETDPLAEGGRLGRDAEGLYLQCRVQLSWRPSEDIYGVPLRNFATVLDAVAERRVAERMQGQTQAPTVTPAQPSSALIGTVMVQDADGTVRPARMNDTARVIGLAGIDMPAAVRPAAQPEPRRFADVRPDRHGWRWWRVYGHGEEGTRIENQRGWFRWHARQVTDWLEWGLINRGIWFDRTVIPTDEQGNPVSWESIGPTDPTEMRYRQALVAEGLTPGVPSVPGTAQTMTVQASPGRVYYVEWAPTNATTGSLRDVLHTARIRQLDQFVAEAIRAGNTGGFSMESRIQPQGRAVSAVSEQGSSADVPLPLPRFTTDELDDVDHSKTTKLDEVTLRRGKLPTVEQIAKYREVRARRTGGTVADALKESRIDCEVAQYVLERWAGGLGDADTVLLLQAAGCMPVACVPVTPSQSFRRFDTTQGEVDRRSQDFLHTHNATLDTSEKPSPAVQRERQEAEERRQRLAELRQRLAAERAAQPQELARESEVSRFDLIEPDPQADPAASIRAWEARQAAAKVRPVPALPRIVKPAAVPRRPAIEVVDAEVDGLSRSEAFTALFGRALNGGC